MEEFRLETYVAVYHLMDGILTCSVKNDQIVDERLASRITHERCEVSRGISYPTLIVIPRNHLLMENEALQFFGSKEGAQETLALAVVIKSSLRTILSNFSFMFYKQKTPFRVFTSRSEAKLWLFGFIKDKEGLEL